MLDRYREALLELPLARVPDWYAIHQQVCLVTKGDPRVRYAPHRLRGDRLQVILRAPHGEDIHLNGLSLVEKALRDGDRLAVRGPVRIVRQTKEGERMPTVEEAGERWCRLLDEGGFRVESVDLEEASVNFYHRRLRQHTRLPFWQVSSVLTVTDSVRAALSMAKGIGRSRGLGFGMLMEVQ